MCIRDRLNANSTYYLNPAVTSVMNRIDASIYYDFNDTAYYINLDNSADAIRTKGAVSIFGQYGDGTQDAALFVQSTTGDWSIRTYAPTSNYGINVDVADSASAYAYRVLGASAEKAKILGNGTAYFPLIYDFGDTGFYWNGGGTSKMATTITTGNATVNGLIIGNNSNNLILASNSAGGEISFWNAGGTQRLTTIAGNGDVSLQVSTANLGLSIIPIGAGSTSIILNTWQDSTDGRNWAFRNRYTAHGRLELMRSTSNSAAPLTVAMSFDGAGGNTISGPSIAAPSFVDSSNSGYYVDPAGTSTLYRILFNEHLVGQTAGGYVQMQGASAYLWAIGSGGGTLVPGATSSTHFGVHVYNGSAWSNPLQISPEGYVRIGGSPSAYPYGAGLTTKLMFGASDSNTQENYYIGTNTENYGGNYTKLDIRFHTGIRMGAQSTYGGIRMFENEDIGTCIFSVGEGDLNVRTYNYHYAKRFIDIDSTGYYLDPASTSVLNQVLAGTTYAGTSANGYFDSYGANSAGLHRIARISLDPNVGYNDSRYQGIESTDSDGTFTDSVSINSYNDITLRLDSNNNNAASYLRLKNNTITASPQIGYWGFNGADTEFWNNGTIENVSYLTVEAPAAGVDAGSIRLGGGVGYNSTHGRIAAGSTGHLYVEPKDGQNLYLSWYSSSGGIWSEKPSYFPTYYDRGNTNYYMDLNSTGTSINIAGSLKMNAAGAKIKLCDAGSNSGGGLYWSSAGTSASYAIYRDTGSWTHPYPDLRIKFHTGIAYNARSDYDGHRFYTGNTGDGDTLALGIGPGGSSTHVIAYSNMRAPEFYDNNDTTYYADFASTSTSIAIAGTINISGCELNEQANGVLAARSTSGSSGMVFRSVSNTWHATLYAEATSYGFLNGEWASWDLRKDKDDALYLNNQSTYYLNPSATSTFDDLRSAIYYDFNNTTFYLDLHQTGTSIRAAGNIIAYYSDERLKTKLGPIENALDKIDTLSGFYYEPNHIAQALGYEKKRHVGVSAQEVEAVLPEVVSDAPVDSRYLTVDYAKIVPLLIEGIKELKAEIEKLKKGGQ